MDLIGFFFTLGYSIVLICMLLDFEAICKKGIFKMGILVTIILVCNVYLWISLGYQSFMTLYPVFVMLPLFIIFRFFSVFKGIKLFFVLLTVMVLSYPPILTGYIVSALFDRRDEVLSAAYLIIYLPITFIVYKYLRPLFLYMLRNTKKGWGTFCLIPLSFNAYTYLTGRYDLEIVRDEGLLMLDTTVTVLIIAAYVLILRHFKQTREQIILQTQQNILAIQVSALKARSETLREAEEKTIIYRHDMRHHLHLINGFLAENKLSEMKKYIAEIEKNIDATVTTKYCENNVVNLVLSHYINKAENEKIKVDCQIYIPKHCEVSDMDLCIILSNAFENAINACMNIKDIKDRRIDISCKSKNDKLFIQVSNNFAGEVRFQDDMPISTIENHGFGTKSIAATVQKYMGLYSFTAEGGVFKARVIL